MLQTKTGYSGHAGASANIWTPQPAAAAIERAHAAWGELTALRSVPDVAWLRLSVEALEPNAFYDPVWAKAVAAHADGRTDPQVLLAWDGRGRNRLIGLLPVVSSWRAFRLPLPLMVAWHAYAPLATPLLDRADPSRAWSALLDAAEDAGARALLLPSMSADGPAAHALGSALTRRNLSAIAIAGIERASLDATRDADTLLREALGAKKLKELRRQRHRLADSGPVAFESATSPADTARTLETFLALEAMGWKARQGTALLQHAGDAAFIRQAVPALAAQGRCEIVSLARGGVPVACGIVLRHGSRAFFFKITFDEQERKNSPGVQLTLDLTRHLCADPAIADVDSTADADHPMIDHVWRGRLAMADLFVPLRADDLRIAAIRTILIARHAARNRARRIVRAIRSVRERYR
ncbi:MAG: GNAT family N-acetyltransferase [Pseudorhodoplanes sp.]|nr:GNAT family N-acetyltransferase [Pseudorhodoplanes sp.]